jgi:hypothetical protein
MFRAKCEANQDLGNRRRLHTPMRLRSTAIVQPRRFDARAGGSEHSSPTFGTEAVDGESLCSSLTPYIGMESSR